VCVSAELARGVIPRWQAGQRLTCVRLASGFLCVLLSLGLPVTAASPAERLYREARRAEQQGDVLRAYLLYTQAAAHNPDYRDAWARSLALRRKALLAVQDLGGAAVQFREADSSAEPPKSLPSGIFRPISEQELREAERLAEPVRLRPRAVRKSWRLRGDTTELYRQVCPAYGLDVIFDAELRPRPALRLEIEEAGYREALRALQAATGTFVVPVSEHLILVADDTPQKRQQLEPVTAALIPLSDTLATQELQELAQAVQQVMEVRHLAIDTQRQMALIRDRASTVEAAAALFRQLLGGRGEAAVEVELIEISSSYTRRYGMGLPASLPVAWLSSILNSRPSFPGAARGWLAFGGGYSFLAVGVTDAELFASMTRLDSRKLLRAVLRSASGQQASLHVGDRFPLQLQGYFGPVEATGPVYTPPPMISFEDLGFVLKLTPYVHSEKEVTLEVDAEVKLLAGSSINGIPILSSRTVQTAVRLREGQWAILAGLTSQSEAETISGLWGLSEVPVLGPFFRRTSRDSRQSQVVVVLKPHVVRLPVASVRAGQAWLTGSETRPWLPL